MHHSGIDRNNNAMTTLQQWYIHKYLIYRTLTSMWFVGAVWLYFYRIFITDQQVGVLDGIAFAIGLLAEVPSGALADKFGRDRLVKTGQLLAGLGIIIQALGSSFLPFFIGQTIMMVGVAFVSGADEALFYQKLKFNPRSREWRKLVMKGSQFALMGGLFATLLGAILHTINPRVPWLLNGLAFIIAALVVWQITDDRPSKARQKFSTEFTEYLEDIRDGFREFRLTKLALYVPYILIVQGLFYATGYGLLRLVLLDRFAFNPFWGSVVIASSSVITVGLLAYMHRSADRLSEKKVLVLIGVAAASSLLLSTANIGAWGFFVILALYAGEHVLQPFMSETLNTRAPEQKRATILSVASFLKTLPYVVLAPIIGYLNTHDALEYFLVIWALLILTVLAIYIHFKQQDSYIRIVDEI